MTEEKEELIDISLYTGYLLLVTNCELPTKLKKDKFIALSGLDHYVVCATKYNLKNDEITRAHCDEIWKKWNTQELNTSINLCVRVILHPAPSETILIKTKLVHMYLNGLINQPNCVD